MRSSRRVVTVLFADLVGFTALSERLDPEDVAAVQQAYFARAQETLQRHGGVVEKFIGDAVVGSFGVLRARDDDAEQAIRGALDIVASVQELGELFELDEPGLQVRVGVNTGEVLITGDRDGDWQLTGDVVNVASRLQSRAQPGSVLVGPDTALAVESSVLLEPAGGMTLKGRTEPLDVFNVVAPRSAPVGRTTFLGGASGVVGRESETRLLLDAWTSSDTVAQSWLLTAPPGAGKSRLVAELADRVTAQGGQVWATAAAAGDNGGYRCVGHLIRQSLGPAADSADLVGELEARLRHRGASDLRAAVSAEHVRALLAGEELSAQPEDLFASWLAVLEAAEGDHAPVWIVEDLHMAGPDLVDYLHTALAASTGSRRLLVMTSRPSPSVEALAAAEPALQSLHLDPLSVGATGEMAEALLGRGVLSDELVTTIAERSRGNPLFIEELFRSWAQAGVLQPLSGGSWRLAGTGSTDRVPTTVQSVYLGQLDGLPDQPRQVIHSGSIPGYTFPSAALPVLEVADAGAGLQLLTELGLLMGPHDADVHPASYTYRHGLLREVAYASLSRVDRARLHLRFARWVDQGRSGNDADEAVGRHLAAAYDNLPRLAEPLEEGLTRNALAEEAGERLELAAELHRTSAPLRAAVLLERALAVAGGAEPRVTLRRRLRLGVAQLRSGRLEDAMRTFAAVGDTARLPEDVAALVTAALGYEDALFASRLPRDTWGADGSRLLGLALEAGPPDDLRARLLAALGRTQVYGGAGLEKGRATCAQAVRLATASRSDSALAYALLASLAGMTGPHLGRERRGALRLAGEAARRADDGEAELETARLQLVEALEEGDVEASEVARSRATELVEELRRPLYFWYPPMWEAMRALMNGDPSSAEPLVRTFRDEGTRWHYRDVVPVHMVQELELWTLSGDPARALPLLRSLFARGADPWASVLAAALARSGEAEEARQLFGAHIEGSLEHPKDLSWTYLAALRAEVVEAVGNAPAAAELSRLLEPWEGRAVVLGSGAVCLGAVSHFRGLAARTAGDLDTAVRCFRDAVMMNDSMVARWAAARSRHELDRTVALTEASTTRSMR